MASFRSHGFKEGAEGAGTFPVWHRKARSAILDLPGSNEDIIQRFGRKSDTLGMLATVTAASWQRCMAMSAAPGALSTTLARTLPTLTTSMAMRLSMRICTPSIFLSLGNEYPDHNV
jgi:hypothetical protein